jgi:hypothetical protein
VGDYGFGGTGKLRTSSIHYAEHSHLAQKLGGADRVARLWKIADKHKLNMNLPAHRKIAEEKLYDEDNNDVQDSKSFDEALRSVLRKQARGKAIDFSEADHANAARLVAKARPDLLTEIGSSATMSSVADEPADDVAVTMAEAHERELKLIPGRYDQPEAAQAEAARKLTQKHPKLVKKYSTRYGRWL